MSSKTVIKNLEWATRKLAASDTARLDAEILLAHTLRLERVDLYLNKERTLTDEESRRFEDLVGRRAGKEPVAYITGCKEFWSINIAVTPDVLIPRPETEGIVELALKLVSPPLPALSTVEGMGGDRGEGDRSPPPNLPHQGGGNLDILDLCTGSGCVAAALATELPDATITVTDISQAAIEVAKKNLAFAGNRIQFLTGDLFAAIPLLCKEGSGEVDLPHLTSPYKGEELLFDLITANPPYVGDIDTLQDDIRLYEPRLALEAGTDGLAISKRIIQDAPGYLKAGGTLIMEIGIGQADILKELARDTRRYEKIKVVGDYSGIERILICEIRSTKSEIRNKFE